MCEGTEEVPTDLLQVQFKLLQLSLIQMLELGFVSLCYVWFVLATENAFSMLNCSSEKEFLVQDWKKNCPKNHS